MIERTEYINFLKKLKDKQIIKVITGIRRCGKSTILNAFREYLIDNGVNPNNLITINFEQSDNDYLLNQKVLHDYIMENIVPNEKNYVFLDEIQMVNGFEKCINSLFLNSNIDIYITGSNSYMLSGELATLLTGRYMELHVLPLSFKEYLSYYGETDLLIKYSQYIETGGFPYLINLNNDKILINNYLDSIYNTVLIKDIISRKSIKEPMILDSLVRFLFDNIGSLISTKKISDTLKSNGRNNSVHTIESYLNSLMESYILYRVNRYDIKGKQFLKTLEKYYLSDLGLRTYLLGSKQNHDKGFVLENIIFLELKRRGYKIYIGKNDSSEIDFVIENKDGIKYVQVSLTVRDKATLEREIEPLNNISDHFPKILITMDFDPPSYYNGIKQINAIDFLTNKEEI